MKKIKNYLLAFFIPCIICLCIFYFKNALGRVEDIYVTDLRVQHLGFLNYFKSIMLGESSLFYSFNAGIGSSMLSTMIFYCISPINLLMLVIKDVQYAVLFIYIMKVSLSGLTMYMYLRTKSDKDNLITVLFSTCYALSAFVINYFFCVFWFDSLYFAPLVMLGIDKIIKTEKINMTYILPLTFAIICNIQMGFGLCVFSVIYYLYSFAINYEFKKDLKKFKQLTVIFLISSICAGAISGGALIAFGLDYAEILQARSIEVTSITETSNIGYILKNLFTVGNLKTDYYNNFEPFVYCGLLVTYFSILYLFNKEESKRKKVAAIIVIITFIICFCINFLNVFWHLSVPVMLNYRYSIYLGLFLTMLAYESYVSKQKLVGSDILWSSISLLVGFFMIVCYSNEVYILWSFAFLIVLFIMILLVKNKSKKFEVLLFVLVLGEVFVNGYLSIYTSEQLTFGKYASYDSLTELSNKNNFGDDYRVMYDYSYTENVNDAMLLNKNSSLRYFSSVIHGNVLTFFDRNLATVGNNNYAISAYESPLLLSLFGNKYFYLNNEITNSLYKKVDVYQITSYDYNEKKDVTRDVYLYENPYALTLGYVIEKDVIYDNKMNPVDYQNAIIKAFTGNEDDVMIRLEHNYFENSEECANTIYPSCRTYEVTNHTNNVSIYVHSLFERYSVDTATLPYLDSARPLWINTTNKKVKILFEDSYGVNPSMFLASTYDKNKLINSLTSLQENMVEDVKINKNVLTAKLDSSKSGILFLAIPYDNNFKIYVDDKEVEYYSVLDKSFIGLDIEAGVHDIKLEYAEDNFILYIIISVVSLIGTVVLAYFVNKKVTKIKEIEEEKNREKLNKRLNKKKNKKKK